MKKPIIGIVSKPRLSKSGWNLMYTNDHIKDAIVSNGALAIGIIPQGHAIGVNEDLSNYDYDLSENELFDFYEVLSTVDGLILEGGPEDYKYEQVAAKYAYDNDVPILGICSGQGNQVMALGGINAPIENHDGFHNNYDDEYVHSVIIDKSSNFFKLIGQEKIMVNSYHKNIPHKTGLYKVVGYTEDGLAEITEIDDRLFNIGVRFHPELLFKKDINMNKIILGLINASKIYKQNNNR